MIMADENSKQSSNDSKPIESQNPSSEQQPAQEGPIRNPTSELIVKGLKRTKISESGDKPRQNQGKGDKNE